MNSEFHILIVDDDLISVILMKEYLQSLNVKISEVKNGLEAVKFCKNNNLPDLIITDILMPVMDGFTELKELRKICPDIKVVAQTAFVTTEKIAEIKMAGFNAFVTKPYNKKEFLSVVFKQLQMKVSAL